MANLHCKAQFIKVKRGEYHGHCIGNSFCQLFAASQASIQSLYTSAGSDKSEEMEINTTKYRKSGNFRAEIFCMVNLRVEEFS